MRTMFDDRHRQELLGRLRRLDPTRPARWGRMTAPQVPPHLIDQMRIALGELHVEPMPSPLRYSPLRQLALYVAPWPQGVKGPPETFTTWPANWETDLDTLEGLVERFVQRGPDRSGWPNHPVFGRMNGRDWGVFSHKHFNHHIVQFSG